LTWYLKQSTINKQGVPAKLDRRRSSGKVDYMSTFKDFKNKSKTSINDLIKKLDEGSKKDYRDDRFWRPEPDKMGNGFAVIRFLPVANGTDAPWVKLFSHAFQGPGGWYIENSLTTMNQKDPVSELNTQLWNTGSEEDKNIARNRKRKTTYISNILVIKDEANPQNEGKVFLFKYGTKIFDKIQEKMKPEFKDEEPINPFDLWTGCNFKLKMRKIGGYTNYDKSEFDSSTALFNGDDNKIEGVWNQLNSLEEFVSPSNFKSYDDLKKRLYDVLGGDIRGTAGNEKTAEDIDETDFQQKPSNLKQKPKVEDSADEEIDALSYFEQFKNA